MRISPILAALTLIPMAQAQVGPDDLVLSLWDGTPDVVIVKPDGSVVQSFVSSSSPGRCQGASLTANNEILTGRWLPSGGFTLFDLGGGESEFNLPGLGYIGDTAVLENGDLLVADQDGHVEKFAPDGTYLSSIGAVELDHPWGLFVDDDNTIWVGDLGPGADLFRFDANGTHLLTLELGVGPADIVISPDGTIWTIDEDDGKIYHFATDGTLLFSFLTPFGNKAAGLAMEADGSLLASSWNVNVLNRYAQDGTLLDSITVPGITGGILTISRPGKTAGPIGTSYCGPANPNSSGLPGRISASGLLDVSSNCLVLTADQLPANKLCYCINGTAQAFIANPGGSQGNLCIQGAGRHVGLAASTGPGGIYSVTIDLGQVPRPGGAVAVQPGETWYWQAWFRDKNPNATSNFTDGVCVQFQ